MIRRLAEEDFEAVHSVINDGAEAYRGIIPADRWHEPYMGRDELRSEIAAGVVFQGYEDEVDGAVVAVMGLQDMGEVTLIRHAYVRTDRQRQGLGGKLLTALLEETTRPVLIGTWAAADWAVRFYEKHGFQVVTPEEKDHLLKTYWTIPERQIETSVVLADARWQKDRE